MCITCTASSMSGIPVKSPDDQELLRWIAYRRRSWQYAPHVADKKDGPSIVKPTVAPRVVIVVRRSQNRTATGMVAWVDRSLARRR